MENEETKTPDTETPQKLSIVAEAAKIRDEIVSARDALKEENDRKEKLQAEEMLGGSNGGHVEAEKPKEVSPQDYAKQVMEGKIGDDKED